MKWERLNTLLLIVAIALLGMSLTRKTADNQSDPKLQTGRYHIAVASGTLTILDTATGSFDSLASEKGLVKFVRMPDGEYEMRFSEFRKEGE